LGNVVIIKLWFHLSENKVQKNLKKDNKSSKVKFGTNPFTKKFSRQFDTFLKVSEVAIRITDAGLAPWYVIESADAHYRDFTAARIVHDSLQTKLNEKPVPVARAGNKTENKRKLPLTVLDAVDLTQTLDETSYKSSLGKWQHHQTHHPGGRCQVVSGNLNCGANR